MNAINEFLEIGEGSHNSGAMAQTFLAISKNMASGEVVHSEQLAEWIDLFQDIVILVQRLESEELHEAA